ncbi:MAG TPA: phospholipase D-like domain-containing protein [Thermoanaerobaculia bacterium]|nr:phospholipase D-like domain-containing protein [Thermoanaerobaculia bacterium]
MLQTILLTAGATILVFIVLRNLTTGEGKITHEIEPLYGVEEPPFRRALGHLLGPAIVPGNRVTPLFNGDEIFPAMLAAIRGARQTITFETFIYWSGEIGLELREALSERARAGVKVHVLLDWAGSQKMDERLIQAMIDDGVEVERYHPIRWYNLDRINNRTHRKLLVVDGRTGFTGGVGIADDWLGHAQDSDHWRDNHFQVEGPVVAQMQAAFMDNWLKTRSRVLHGDDYFPALEETGSCEAQMFKSSPSEGTESARLMFLLSIASALRTLYIGNAYFVPDDLAVQTLIDATQRGVKVEIIVPGRHIDTEVTRKASRSRWGKLLEAGIEIYEFQPTMYHCKIMIVDETWVSVGSANFDNRSFRLNDEANLNLIAADFAARQIEVFQNDKTRCQRITLEAWQRRPFSEKLLEHAAGLLRSQL